MDRRVLTQSGINVKVVLPSFFEGTKETKNSWARRGQKTETRYKNRRYYEDQINRNKNLAQVSGRSKKHTHES